MERNVKDTAGFDDEAGLEKSLVVKRSVTHEHPYGSFNLQCFCVAILGVF